MFGFLRTKPNSQELKILDQIHQAQHELGYESLRVINDTTLSVDSGDVVKFLKSDAYKTRREQAKRIANNS